MDAKDSAMLKENMPKLYFGGYDSVKNADIIIYAAGVSKMNNNDRMELLHDNCNIAEEIFTEVNKHNQSTIIICVSNPLDIVTMQIVKTTHRHPHKL